MFSLRPLGLALVPALLSISSLRAQVNYSGGLLVQDFDTLPPSGTFSFSGKGPQALDLAPINAAGAAGWSVFANVGPQLSFTVDAGGATAAAVYSYGVAGSPERALGFLASSVRVCRGGLRLVNNTGQTITQFTLSYVAEEWRSGGTTNANQLAFAYRIQPTAFDLDSSATFTGVSALNAVVAGPTGAATPLNGNVTGNRALIAGTVSGITWPPGHMLMLRWQDTDSTGEDDALALDDVAFFAPAGVAAPPQVATVSPVQGATSVPATSRMAVTFDQPVNVAGTWAQLTDASATVVPVSIAGGPLRFELTPTTRLQPGTTYTLTILAPQVTNPGGAAMPAAFTSTFTTQPAITNLQPISAVQGSGLTTPLAGQTVTVRGIVTADFQGAPPAAGGFFVQSRPADADSDPATSEALFVFDFTSVGGAPVSVGDVVLVTGTAGEFGNQTQLSNVSSLVIEGTAPLPLPADVTLPVATSTALESFEAMRVRFAQTLHVTSSSQGANFATNYARNGELILSAGGPLIETTEIIDPNDDPPAGTNSTGTSNIAAVAAHASANALRTIVLDDASSAVFPDPTPYLNPQGTRRCGDTVTGLEGILSFAGGRYRVQPTGAVTFADTNPRPATPPLVGGRLKVAGMNVLNYFTTFGGTNDRGADSAAEFQRQKDKVIAALAALDADVLGLIEIQNTSTAVADLLAALNAAAPAHPYAVVPDPGLGAGFDAIRTLLLYRPSRLALFGPCHADDDGVWLSPNPLRYPLAQVFEENATGERFIACINHWKSKSPSGASGPDLDQGDGQGAFNELRRRQAERLHTWLQSVRTAMGENDVLVFGDLNAQGEEDPVDVLRANGWGDQLTRFHSSPYSYRFTDARARLDHLFATPSLAAQVTLADHWHINADEPAFYDYNLENKSPAQQALNVGTPFRSSDHDPVLLGLNLAPQPTTYAMWAAARVWPVGAGQQSGDDPDGDGLRNLAEFVLNTDPLASEPALVPTATRSGGNLVFSYRRRTNATGVTLHPEWSPDLVQWYPLTPGAASAVDLRTELQTASAAIGTRLRMFCRLRVVLP